MPDIEFDLESSIGEHKITNGHVALFLINRFKVWNFFYHMLVYSSQVLLLFLK